MCGWQPAATTHTPPPAGFAACPSLKALDLSGVPAVAAAGALVGLTSLAGLAEVSLVRCGLRAFPPALFELPALQVLDLADNKLEQLPGGVSRLGSLRQLTLVNNDLTSLPPELGRLHETLRVLRLDGNALRAIRRSLLSGGTKGLLEYLLTRLPEAAAAKPAAPAKLTPRPQRALDSGSHIPRPPAVACAAASHPPTARLPKPPRPVWQD